MHMPMCVFTFQQVSILFSAFYYVFWGMGKNPVE